MNNATVPKTLLSALAAMLLCCEVFANEYLAAAGHVDITPPVGAYMAGYGQDRKSTGQFDPLFAKVFVVSDGEQHLNIVTIDNIGLTYPDVEPLRRALPGHTFVSSTHTHAGPDVVGIWGPSFWRSGRSESYVADIRLKIQALVKKLHAELKPVTIAIASADTPMDWVENVSEPNLLDTRLTVLRAVDAEGAVVATLTNYACHPTILGPENTRTSADYVAGFYRQMSETLPGEHLFLQGAIGGWVQPIQGDRSHELALATGRQLAAAAAALSQTSKPVSDVTLDFAETVVDIPLENWGFRLLMWLDVLERETEGGAMRTVVSWARIGEVQLISHPGETSPAFSHDSRELLGGEHQFVLGLTQDAMGYILKPDYFSTEAAYPHGEYLTSVSVGVEAGPLIMEAVARLAGSSKADSEAPRN